MIRFTVSGQQTQSLAPFNLFKRQITTGQSLT
jgi:hypothetical protein